MKEKQNENKTDRKGRGDGDTAQRHLSGSLPKRETLCLTRAANLQKILRQEERRGKGGTVRAKRATEMFGVTQIAKERSGEIKDIAQQEGKGWRRGRGRGQDGTESRCTVKTSTLKGV